MVDNPVSPETWLLGALRDNLSDEKRVALLRDYAFVKRCYGVSQLIDEAKMAMELYQNTINLLSLEQRQKHEHGIATRIATYEATIARYERELRELDETRA